MRKMSSTAKIWLRYGCVFKFVGTNGALWQGGIRYIRIGDHKSVSYGLSMFNDDKKNRLIP